MSKIINELYTVAGIIAQARIPTVYFLTADKFGALVAECHENMAEVDRPKMNPQTCKRINVGEFLTVANSGTNDEMTVHAANQEAARRANFQAIREKWITGKVGHSKPHPEDAFIPKPEVVE